MHDFLAFTHSHIEALTDDAYSGGVTLAIDCLKQIKLINNPKRFPPRLLILLTSPEYYELEKAEQLLNGIQDTFAQINFKKEPQEVPLIGCDVAAVFCEEKIYAKGALLICLASHLIKVQVAVGENARQAPQKAIENLLKGMELNPVGRVDPNPLANRLLLTFLPGFKVEKGEEFYPAPGLHRLLREGVQARVGLTGGVCSVGDARSGKEGFLYAGRRAYKDAAVAAKINSGIPIGVSLNYDFEPTNKVLQVTEVSDDKRTILAFDKCSPAELIEQEGKGVLLVKLSTEGEPTVDLPQLSEGGKSLHLLHKVKPNDYFQIAKPDEDQVTEQLKEGFNQARKRILIQNPIACLTLICRAWYNIFRPVCDIRKVLELVKQEGIARIGGFFDGEMGVDKNGRSLFINGASSCLLFGDEMRERAPLHQVVTALAKFGPLLNDSDRVIEGALKIVLKTGFPGAMLSLILPNRGGDYIVAQEARGKRFEKIVHMTRRPENGNDILAIVARENRPRFIADSRQDPNCDQESVAVSQIISQYVIPLKRLNGTVFGILQVDLGDLRHQQEDEFVKTEKARTLNSLAEIFEAGLNRITNNKETEISLQLDQALNSSLSAPSEEEGLQKFIKAAVKALGVEMGHIRLALPKEALAANFDQQVLTLVAGSGPCYEAGKKIRRNVSANIDSLIYKVFRNGGVTIVNDVRDDSDYHALCNSAVNNEELTAALGQMKSYAAVAFKNEKGVKLGAFSLAVNQYWFFKYFHRKRTMEALARRIAFLIEHLRDRNRLRFLFDVSTKLAEIDLDEMPEELKNALERFCKAIKAEVGSLYLWDEDQEKFILRAQHGWHDESWVNAANYRMEDNWVGIKALKDTPLYIQDLNQYYKDNPGENTGRYAKYMFGQPLSDSYTVEAIGLALKIGRTQKKFGVLAMYRRIESGEVSGFLSTDPNLLDEGAYKIAGLVNALMEHLNDVRRHEEQKQQQAVYKAINPSEVRDEFEAITCQQIIETYNAVEACFYTADEANAGSLSWAAGYRRRPANAGIEEMTGVEADYLIKQAVTNALNGKTMENVAVLKRSLSDEDRYDPRAIATEGLVERVCIPLINDQKLAGVLDLRWDITHRHAGLLHVRNITRNLQQLGLTIGAVYQQHQHAQKAEQGKLGVEATAAYVSQRAHRLLNAIQNMYILAESIMEEKSEGRKNEKAKVLMEKATEYVDTINWTFDLGERVLNLKLERLHVRKIIEESLYGIDTPRECEKDINLTVADDLTVMGASVLLKEIFANIINNAFESMGLKKAAGQVLKIYSAPCSEKKYIEIIFEDNGVGMTKEEIELAERGYAANGDNKSVGVFLSKLLARVQRGSLRYESEKGVGTKAIVKLLVG